MANQGVTPFARFLDNVKAAKHADFAAAPASLVKQSDKFEEMRNHILKLYQRDAGPTQLSWTRMARPSTACRSSSSRR